jgi:hypothetical protein
MWRVHTCKCSSCLDPVVLVQAKKEGMGKGVLIVPQCVQQTGTIGGVVVPDGKGRRQPACQREWKKCREEEGAMSM